jgi:hypothetical protein
MQSPGTLQLSGQPEGRRGHLAYALKEAQASVPRLLKSLKILWASYT